MMPSPSGGAGTAVAFPETLQASTSRGQRRRSAAPPSTQWPARQRHHRPIRCMITSGWGEAVSYAEKRGNLWRARWRAPDGTLESKPGFRTRKDAENYAPDQEAAIRNNTYVDPRAGRITLTEWVNLWYPGLNLERPRLRTTGTRSRCTSFPSSAIALSPRSARRRSARGRCRSWPAGTSRGLPGTRAQP